MKTKIFILCVFLGISGLANGQEKDKYLFGSEQKLEMVVHIFGEVRNPGEQRIPDNTDVLELISKAGGPTEFSNLGSVRLTRFQQPSDQSDFNGNGTDQTYKLGKRVVKINLDKYLKDKKSGISLPILKPGDVVFVPRNNWYRWRNIVAIARDLSAIASLYYFVIRN